MMFQHLLTVSLLALASASVINHEAEHQPRYRFRYDVHDSHTGDIKNQEESRDGDHVEGRYSLIEPDGSRRVVEYSANSHSGFNAIVRKEAGAHYHSQKLFASQPAHSLLQVQTIQPQLPQQVATGKGYYTAEGSDSSYLNLDKQQQQFSKFELSSLAANDLLNSYLSSASAYEGNALASKYASSAYSGSESLDKYSGSLAQQQLISSQQHLIPPQPQLIPSQPQLISSQPQLISSQPQLISPAPALLDSSRYEIQRELQAASAHEAQSQHTEIKIEHVQPIKQTYAAPIGAYGHSEVRIEQQLEPKHESLGLLQLAAGYERQQTEHEYTEAALKIAESHSSSSSGSSSSGSEDGYSYEKPAVKFELPSKSYGL